ncbi:hypothetical protein, partial [Pedobacter sp. UBA4863]|uniref:hypothetical protein n=1 Tax=Pedobacter sp. UBA4863 TaxID=1947060 RepID=UPI0025FBE863
IFGRDLRGRNFIFSKVFKLAKAGLLFAQRNEAKKGHLWFKVRPHLACSHLKSNSASFLPSLLLAVLQKPLRFMLVSAVSFVLLLFLNLPH